MNHKNISDLTLDDLNGESLEHYGIPGQKWGVRRYQNEDELQTEEDILKHYGILGMKWGVRRFQNEDGTLTAAGKKRYSNEVVKKGTKVHRTTGKEDALYDEGTFVSANQVDRDYYRGKATQELRNYRNGEELYEHTYVLDEDVKVAPFEETCQKFLDAYKDPKLEKEIIDTNADRQTRHNFITQPLEYVSEMEKIASSVKGKSPKDTKEYDALVSKITKLQETKKLSSKYSEKTGIDKKSSAEILAKIAAYYKTKQGQMKDTINELKVMAATGDDTKKQNARYLLEMYSGWSIGKSSKMKQYIMDWAKKNGYGAIYDNSTMNLTSPKGRATSVESLVIFGAKNILKDCGSVKLTQSQMNRSAQKWNDWKSTQQTGVSKQVEAVTALGFSAVAAMLPLALGLIAS